MNEENIKKEFTEAISPVAQMYSQGGVLTANISNKDTGKPLATFHCREVKGVSEAKQIEIITVAMQNVLERLEEEAKKNE